MKIKIVSNDETTATVLGPQDVKDKLVKMHQFRPDNYFFNPKFRANLWDGWIRPINSYGNFPKGLLFSICSSLENLECEYEVDYNSFPQLYEAPVKLCDTTNITNESGEFITPFDYQIEGAKRILTEKRIVLQSATGSGKSLLAYLVAKSLIESDNYKKLLIIVPTISLVSQLFADFEDYAQKDDSFDVAELCHKVYAGADKRTDKPIVISTWQSLVTIVNDKSFFEKFDSVFVDEVQTSQKGQSVAKIVNACTSARIKVGVTGTLDAQRSSMTQLHGLFGADDKITSTKELMDKNILSKLEIKSVLLKHQVDVPKLDYKTEIDYIVGHKQRNKFICNLVGDQTGNSLILFQLVEKHGKPLYKMLKEMFPEKEIYFIHGGVKVDDREAARKAVERADGAIILASYQTFQAGVNIKKLHNVIFASPSKSEIRVFQSIGRTLRKHETKERAILYDIADDLRGNRRKQLNYTMSHFKSRVEMYYKEGLPVKFIELEI